MYRRVTRVSTFANSRSRDVATVRLEFFHFSRSVMTLVGGECHKSGLFIATPISILPDPTRIFPPEPFSSPTVAHQKPFHFSSRNFSKNYRQRQSGAGCGVQDYRSFRYFARVARSRLPFEYGEKLEGCLSLFVNSTFSSPRLPTCISLITEVVNPPLLFCA
jgi:hypothetical protein